MHLYSMGKILLCSVVLLAGIGCGEDSDNGNGPEPDHPLTRLDAADAGSDMSQPDRTQGDAAKKLTSSHTGYKKPLCFDCHGKTATYPHSSSGYKEPKCGECHGVNGAPHKDHATKSSDNCSNCHSSTSHVSSFKVPDDCVDCHYHPGT